MANPITIDPGTLQPTQPWTVLHAFSPPEKWDARLVALLDPAMLSQFVPRAWGNRDITQVPPLVPPPPFSCDSELHDLLSLIAFRSRFETQIGDENMGGMSYFVRRFRDLLRGAGVNLGQLLPNNVTARDHIDAMSKVAFSDASCLALHQKALYNRIRPYQLWPRIFPMFTPPHPAYPSGHSTQLHTLAWTLSEGLLGTNYEGVGALFSDYAHSVARRREIAGVHYASDTLAGMTLAHAIVDRYRHDAAFEQQYLAPLRAIT